MGVRPLLLDGNEFNHTMQFSVSPDMLERRLVVERHMEYFLANSVGFLALVSSCYFQRLW